ncbi:MAG: glycogen/starch/alpha-glucan phosphorylase, partial [Oscillospiraceae bacterium]
MLDKNEFLKEISYNLSTESKTSLNEASVQQLHDAVAKAVIADIQPLWKESSDRHSQGRRAYYFSAEFLMGRAVFNNLYCAGLLDVAKEVFEENGLDLNALEDIEDAALGNGGLGRLAACYLDSAATQDIPLDGYGIRYRYGLFRQSINDGFQQETADNWLCQGKDAWGLRAENDTVKIEFADGEVLAVPYDTPIIGYGGKAVNTLRLWQSESLNEFCFSDFDNQDYTKASEEKILAEAVTNVLYPNDNSEKGLKLRLKQQYFFSSASIQDIVSKYKKKFGSDFSKFSKMFAIQLNDTHPTISIPELIRILMFKEGLNFKEALTIATETFNYTNHTVMAEALEKWDVRLFKSVAPTVFEIIRLIDADLRKFLEGIGQTEEQISEKAIIDGGKIHMARMAVYCSSHTNGVAEI